jgi:hypothetical protein
VETDVITGSTMPLELRHAAFLLERLAADSAPLQEYRELTKNALEAIERAQKEERERGAKPPPGGHQVVWDAEWVALGAQVDAGQKPVYKLSIWDTGDGMTGEEMVEYINHLASSSGVQALDRNFGVGAKITAGVQNPAGLIYTSLKNGEVHQIHFWRDPDTNEYGIRPYEARDGTYHHWRKLKPSVLPKEIIAAGHGTMVTLLGSDAEQNTMKAPTGAIGGVRWLVRYLNRRFLAFPEDVTVRVREFASSESDWPTQPTTYAREGGMMRPGVGQAHYLDKNADTSGEVRLDNGHATAYWWLLKDEKLVGDRSYWLASGHIAALFHDELYELRDGNAGTRQLMHFGVLFGPKRVVVYVKPDEDQEMTPNTARSQLLANGEPLPWEDWAAEFRENLPDAIQRMMEELLTQDSDGNQEEAIRQRLKRIEDLMRTTRYRRNPAGSTNVSGDATGGSAAEGEAGESTRKRPPGGSGGKAADLYGAFVDDDGGEPADPVNPKPHFPEIRWVSVTNGTRSVDDNLEDRAASYVNSSQNVLLVNEDFRVYTDLVTYFVRQYEGYPGVEKTVPEVIKEWYAQQLVEAVLGVLAVRGSAKWPPNDVDKALSEEALTGVVMLRYNLYQQVSRVLGTRLGSLKEKADSAARAA